MLTKTSHILVVILAGVLYAVSADTTESRPKNENKSDINVSVDILVSSTQMCPQRDLPPKPKSECCGLDVAHDHQQEQICPQTDVPPSPTSECCGLDLADDHREKSGYAAVNQFPWVALLEYSQGHTYCIGGLISSRYVLTAAECLIRPIERVRLGDYNMTNAGPDCVFVHGKQICNDGGISIPIESIIAHPKFKKSIHKFENDIAVIKLRQPVLYNEFIRPICLPTSDITKSPPENLRLILSGWGKNPATNKEYFVVKHYVELPYVPLEACKQMMNNFSLSDHQICVGGEKDLDSCTRDSGGPLMSETDGKYTLHGIVSFGFVPCGKEGHPSVYTKVYSYVEWINSIISK